MPKIDQDSEQEIQLEDLLRFKRAEQPGEAFWGRFDQELHQRMLHSLVKKDPIYVQVLRGLTGRVAQTAGLATAAAALAFAFIAQSEGELEAPREFVAMPEMFDDAQMAATVGMLNVEDLGAAGASEGGAASMDLSALAALASVERDYAIDAMAATDPDSGFQRDFGMDRMAGVAVASADYSVRSVNADPVSVALASLVF